jgi:eukaryotic-like serine/threonine-protein kinase
VGIYSRLRLEVAMSAARGEELGERPNQDDSISKKRLQALPNGKSALANGEDLCANLPAKEVREQLHRILVSDPFQRSERLTSFLTFIVEETLEGRQSELKEYRVGIMVCGRRESYDTRTDPVVRVEARRLRSAIEMYYAQEGCNDPILISLPKGGYVPSFSLRQVIAEPSPLPEPVVIREPVPPRRKTSAAVVLIVVAVVLAAMAGTYILWHMWHSRHSASANTIVLAEFTNTTGDAVFDDALRQGLSAQLEQSPYLNILSDARIVQTLSLMGKPANSRLTPEVAREVCERTGEQAVIEGSISKLGSQYVIGIKAVNCQTGDSLAEVQASAAAKEQVLEAMAKGATKLRHKLGESLASVKKYDAPPENVTTPSLEALQSYSMGFQVHVVSLDEARAAELFQRAVTLDPNFAMAYARLAVCYGNLGELGKAIESMRKAYDLREHVNEHEKLFILSLYHQYVTGNLEEARKTYEVRAQIYPYDDIPIGNVGNVYFALGQYDKAVADTQEAMRRNSGSRIWSGNLVGSYIALGQLKEAKAAAESARSRQLDSSWLHLCLYLTAFLQKDAQGMQQEASQLKNAAGFDDELLYYQAQAAARTGRLNESRGRSLLAVELAQQAGQPDSAAVYMAAAALNDAWAGNTAAAQNEAEKALEISSSRDGEAIAAVALAMTGNKDKALHLADDLSRRFPEDTLVRCHFVPAIRSAAVLYSSAADKDPGKALDELAAAAPYEMGSQAIIRVAFLTCYPVYLRGQAYLELKQGPQAAAEFQKILDHPQLTLTDPVGAMARLGLARAYALSGDRVKSLAAYEAFLAINKDADPNARLKSQAAAEYAKLKK